MDGEDMVRSDTQSSQDEAMTEADPGVGEFDFETGKVLLNSGYEMPIIVRAHGRFLMKRLRIQHIMP